MNYISFFSNILFLSTCLASLIIPKAHVHADWQPAETLSDPAIKVPTSKGGPVLSVNPQGNAACVWTYEKLDNDTFTDPVIASSFYTQGIGWSAPHIISRLALNSANKQLYTAQGDPDVAMNSSNYAVAAWEGEYSEDQFPSVIIATFRNNDGTWSPVTNISSESGDIMARNANVAVNQSGTAVVAWRQTDTVNDLDYTTVSFLPFSGSWTPPYNISSPEYVLGDDDNKPCVQINSDGNVVVVWTTRFSSAGNPYGITAATYDANLTTWSAPVVLDSGAASDTAISLNPRCAIAPGGQAVAVWINTSVLKAAYFNGTSWLTAVTLDSNANSIIDPMVVMDAQGNATATWTSNSGQLLSSTLPFGGTWTTPDIISSINSSSDPFMSQETLAVDEDGNLIVIWTDTDNGNLLTSFKLFGQNWETPQLVFNERQNLYTSVGLASCGFAVATWEFISQEANNQVKAAINGNLLLPQNPILSRCCDKFGAQKRCLTFLSWEPLDCIVSYRIYRCEHLISEVCANDPLDFIDYSGCKDKCCYSISSINTYGFESNQVPFVFSW